METSTLSQDLRRYLALLWYWAWLLALATVLAGAAAYLVSQRTTPVYQATTTLLINEAPSARSNEYTALLTSERLARTYSELLTKGPALQGVIDRLALDMTPGDLAEELDVQLVRDTQLIEVNVEDVDPVRAAAIANTLVEVFSEQNQALQASRFADSKTNLEAQLAQVDAKIQEAGAALEGLGEGSQAQAERDRLEANLAQYRQTYAGLLQSYEEVRVAEAQSNSNVVQVEPATPPDEPIRPRTLVTTALAATVALMVAVGTVFLMEALDDTLKTPDEVTRRLGLPVLGLIGRIDAKAGELIAAHEPRSPVAESFRSLRTNIQYASVDRPLRSLLVTSPTPEDGKSTVAANLGVVMAHAGRKVVLVDADMRRPKLHTILDIPNRQGLSHLFVQTEVFLNGLVQATRISGLGVLTTGALPPNPAELVGSQKMVAVLEETRKMGDLVVIDSPPLMAVTDAAILASRVDGVLLVIKPGATRLGACLHAVEQLHRSGANLLGVVLNDVDLKSSRYNYYYSGYYQIFEEYHEEASAGRGRKTGPRRSKPRLKAPPADLAQPAWKDK